MSILSRVLIFLGCNPNWRKEFKEGEQNKKIMGGPTNPLIFDKEKSTGIYTRPSYKYYEYPSQKDDDRGCSGTIGGGW